jgi:hypothetical protein
MWMEFGELLKIRKELEAAMRKEKLSYYWEKDEKKELGGTVGSHSREIGGELPREAEAGQEVQKDGGGQVRLDNNVRASATCVGFLFAMTRLWL